MKLLLFSDLHRSTSAARRLVARSAGFDVAVCAGDLANMHEGLPEMVDALSAMKCPVVLVPGNGERFDALEEACRSWEESHVLHGTGATIGGVRFFGLGGGVPPTPFGSWSYDFTEAEADELLADCPRGCVLVSHSPPQGAVDVAGDGRSLGSTAVRRTIERKNPVLVVCGHIHACGGRHERVGTTPVVNAGPGGVDWELA